MSNPSGRGHSVPDRVPLYHGIPDDREAFWKRLSDTYGDVAPVLLEPGVPAWLLLSYEANYRVMVDHATFARDPRNWRDLESGAIPADSGIRAINEKRQSVLYSDGEEHRFLARGLNDAFAAFNDRWVVGEIQRVADELVDRFCTRGRADLISEYARLLPLHVLCRLFGMDPDGVVGFAYRMQKLWEGGAEAPAAAAEIKELLTGVARARRAAPGNDLPSRLIASGQSDDQVCDQLSLIIAGTNDLVTHTIGAVLRQLLVDAWLAAEFAQVQLLVSETVNYVMLHSAPMEVLVGRFPRHDLRLGGYDIRTGDCLVLGFAAANADLRSRTPPDAVMNTQAHLTFGAGQHRCPRYGRDLGLAMAELAVTCITRKLPNLRLAEPPEQHRWVPHVNVRGLVDLPVLFTPVDQGRGPA